MPEETKVYQFLSNFNTSLKDDFGKSERRRFQIASSIKDDREINDKWINDMDSEDFSDQKRINYNFLMDVSKWSDTL